jgi:hypothetical protein
MKIDMPSFLSNTANLFMTSILFAPLIPLSIPICFIGMVLAYFSEKYLLLNRHKIPE